MLGRGLVSVAVLDLPSVPASLKFDLLFGVLSSFFPVSGVSLRAVAFISLGSAAPGLGFLQPSNKYSQEFV